ncbi:MAG: sigma 54-interacting transcriptional regulator OrpR [Candidatus Abyssubacteria bacterium]
MKNDNHIVRNKERDIILDSIADGVFTVDDQWRITSFNRAAEEITGISRDEAIGSQCCDVFKASICESDCALRKTLEDGRPIVNKAVYIITAEGERIPISISTALLKDESGRTIGGVETFRDLSVVEDLRKELTRKYTFADIISKNHKMQALFDILPEAAESDSTVLIEGESGTGKELFARALHNLSPRRKKPMITVNCGALPDTLLESELFGYKAGAFTDAKKDKPGRFALAKGGTIFLDEIGDISPALQVRLLRVLQEKTYEPLGATEPVAADVRVVAATNKDLAHMVAQGHFRQDLYYRINVMKLSLPPLRERLEDVPLLVDHLIARFNRLRQKSIAGVSPEVMTILMNHNFPGNVRELENIIEHAFILCRNGMILPQHLPQNLRPELETVTPASATSMQEMETHFIRNCLQRHNWNRTTAAQELGVHKTTLWRKMKRLGIEPPQR